MKFKYNESSEINTIKFMTPLKTKLVTITVLVKTFQRLGAKFPNGTLGEIEFPSFITSQVIQEIINNTCFVCGGLMTNGQALDNTWVGFDDFGGDAGQVGTTISKIGPPIMKNVRKCSSCGHSHT